MSTKSGFFSERHKPIEKFTRFLMKQFPKLDREQIETFVVMRTRIRMKEMNSKIKKRKGMRSRAIVKTAELSINNG